MFCTRSKSIRIVYVTAGLLAILFCVSCGRNKSASPEAKLRFEGIIPKPVSANLTGNTFSFTEDTKVVTSATEEGVSNVASFLVEKLKPATGFNFEVSADEKEEENSIVLSISEDAELGQEGYELTVS